MTTNTSMIDISAIAFQRNFVHNNTKELSQKVNISYFWLISFRQKIIYMCFDTLQHLILDIVETLCMVESKIHDNIK